MSRPLRLAVSGLLLGLFLGDLASAALAQQFYNPWHYHRTRQSINNRQVNRRIARKHRRKVTVKRTTKRTTTLRRKTVRR